MPSPFPGMDPYLEDPILWRGVHHRLITYVADTLSARLPRRYIANIDERLYVVQADRDIYPDVLVKQRKEHPVAPGGRTLVAEETALDSDPPLVLTLEPVEIREAFIEILLAENAKLVTVIEVLSPSNKLPGSPGREQYLSKQRELLKSQTHLLEIDLLRSGVYTVSAPLTPLTSKANWDYVISLQRGGHNRCETWPVTIRQRLPRVRVPLSDGDPDLVLDLQATFDHCYDAGAYARQIDYRRDPAVPLPATDAAWADALLRERRLRL